MSRDPVIDALGVRIRLDLSGMTPSDAAAVHEAWAGAGVGPEASAHLVLRVAPAGDREWWLPELSRRVTAAAIEHQKGQGWMLHATGLADADGRVVAFVGESGAGKTTVAAALGRRYGYVSDETVFIGAGGEVLSYRKPLSVRGVGMVPKTETAPTALALRGLPSAPLTLAAIVLLERRDDVVEPTARELSIGEAVTALTAHTSFLSHLQKPLQFLAAILADTAVLRLSYRDVRDLGDVSALWQARPDDRRAAPAVRPPGEEGRISRGMRRAAVADAIAPSDADQLLVLHDDTVHTLDGIAPTLWRALAEVGGPEPGANAGDDLTELTADLVAAHGVPPNGDGEHLVAAAVAELREAGLIVGVGSGWRVAGDCAWRESTDGRVVALPLRALSASRPVVLDDVGSLIWRAVASVPGAATPQVCRLVEHELLDPPENLIDYVGEFIASLERSLLVDRV